MRRISRENMYMWMPAYSAEYAGSVFASHVPPREKA